MFVLVVVILFVFVGLLGFYTYKFCNRFLSLFDFKKRPKVIVSLVVSCLAIIISSNMFRSGAMIVIHWFIFSLLVDLLFYIIKRKTHNEYVRLKNSGVIPVVLTIIVMLYAHYNMVHVVRTNYTVNTDKELSQNYKVLLITDLHFGTTMDIKKLANVVNKINKNVYDFAILGGDIVDENTTKQQMADCFKLLSHINTRYGMYFTYGNHDKQTYTKEKAYSEEELASNITQHDIKILKDDVVSVNNEIIVFGRDDVSMNDKRLDTKEVTAAFDKDKFWLVIDHQPLDISYNAKLGVDLQVSGHTHAGQMFPLNQFIEMFINEVSFGHETRGDYDVVVSSGMGGWGFPLRTSAHSEFVVIDIKSN